MRGLCYRESENFLENKAMRSCRLGRIGLHPLPWRFSILVLFWTIWLVPSAWAARVTLELPDRSTTLPIYSVGQRPYVDAQAVASLVSGRLRVNPSRGSATLRMGSHTLALSLNKAEIRVGDRDISISGSPVLQGKRLLVPLDVLPVVLGERFGPDAVHWDPDRRVARVRSGEATITRLRVGMHPSHTRVVLETAGPLEWAIQQEGADGLQVVLPGGVLAPNIHPVKLRTGVLRAVQPAQRAGGAEIALTWEQPNTTFRAFTLGEPDRIVIDVLVRPPEAKGEAVPREAGGPPSPVVSSVTPPRSPVRSDPHKKNEPTAETSGASGRGSRPSNDPVPPSPKPPETETPPATHSADREAGSPLGAPGALIVVLDPGHGGHETGAVGPKGLMEKDVVLDLAFRLRRLLQDRLGVRVVMTRTEDVFVPLQERTAVANRVKADFFISLHVNGSTKRGAVGFETFYFTREPSDNDARASAQRENLVIERDGTTGTDQDSLLRITLADMAVTRDIRESSELAELTLSALDKILKVENRGVKSGPFYVLATAAMPAILVESAFITNPKEERKLQREQYRQRLAEALVEGIATYKVRYERRVGMRGGATAATGS